MVEASADTASDALLLRLKTWLRADKDHSAEWRKEAQEDFDFAAGKQWSDTDVAKLRDDKRPVITFNRILPIINSVAGQEMASKNETRYIPREPGDVKPNEILTEAARWFRDVAEADDEDSEAFQNAVICGMGWTETTLNYDENPEGQPKVDSINPLEMFWDKNARKKNLVDAERVWRVRKMALSRAKHLFPDAEDGDLDAKWAALDTNAADTESQEQARRYEGNSGAGSVEDAARDDREVTIVHGQWAEWQTYHQIIDWAGRKSELTAGKFASFSKRAKAANLPFMASKLTKRVIKDAFIGGKVLETGEALCPKHFRFQCITAHQNKNDGLFFGLVRMMKDPQRWANRWLSQALDILNSQAKGGVMIEKGATDDMREFERTWARPDRPTIVPPGFLSNANGAKVVPKPGGEFPTGFMQLMEFAISSVRDSTGVSLETLGMREADQPASLEYQRRQAGMLILQPLMKNLRRYVREQGKMMLYIIQNYLNDGRLVRIVGEDGAKYVPMALNEATEEYDIIVDEAPTSPNQKEAVWAWVGDRFWDLPPEIQSVLMDHTPLPSSVVEKIREAGKAGAEQSSQMAQQMAALEAKLKEVEAGLKEAQTQKTHAEAAKIASEIGQGGEQMMQQPEQPDIARNMIEAGKADAKTALEERKFEFERQIKEADLEIRRAEAVHSMQMAEMAAAAKSDAENRAAPEPQERPASAADIVQPLAQAFDRIGERIAQASVDGARLMAETVTDAIRSGAKRVVRDNRGQVVGVEPVLG